MQSRAIPLQVPEEANKSFRATFGKSKMFFNHFVKLYDNEIINRQLLWILIARGAAGICAHYQIGIDIVIPFLFWDHRLRRENISAIFIQCKNNKTFQGVPKQHLFDMMDPYYMHFFDEKETAPLPEAVICMVFALALLRSQGDKLQCAVETFYRTGTLYQSHTVRCSSRFRAKPGPGIHCICLNHSAD